MQTYIDWMMSCAFITVTELPAISVPCGFTDGGLPVGLQIVGRPRSDFSVLQLAYAFQEATRFYQQKPPNLPKSDLKPYARRSANCRGDLQILGRPPQCKL